jgi:hypothetical protein
MSRNRIAAASLLTSLAGTPAAAAVDIDVSAVVRTACAGVADPTTEQNLPMERLAEAILIHSDFPPSRLLGNQDLTAASFKALLINTVKQPAGQLPLGAARTVRAYVERLGEDLGPDSNVSAKARGLKLTSQPPSTSHERRRWLFDDEGVKIACMPAKVGPMTVADSLDVDSTDLPPGLGVTKKIEDLALTGDARKIAESATIGAKRIRTLADDGTRKTSTTLTFDGTLGVRLTGPEASSPGFMFANYTLSRERAKPPAELAAGERRDDKDTNGLSLGLQLTDIELLPVLAAAVQTSYVMDFVKGSRRGVGSVLLTPAWGKPKNADLGICRFGALKPISLNGFNFRTQCYAAAQLEFSHVFRVGRADFKKHGDFFAAGLVLGIDVAPPVFEKSGVVASLRYRYLPTISGTAPDVSRWDAALKYRWWLGGGGAFDMGVTYKGGEEFKTYSDEDSLELTLGFIF